MRGRKKNVIVGDDGPNSGMDRAPIFSSRPWEFEDSRLGHKAAPKESLVVLARKHTMEAVLTLVHHMRNSHDPEISIKAAATLLDRGWGKAAELVGIGNANGALEDLSSMSVAQRIDILEAAADGVALPASAAPISAPTLVDGELEPAPESIDNLLD
jgi:hypothetical protein